MDVSLEAELLVAGSDEGVMAVWSLADKQLIHSLQGHTGQSVFIVITIPTTLIIKTILTNHIIYTILTITTAKITTYYLRTQ